MKRLCDRHGRELTVGALVHVQETSGPYGQTRRFKARIESLEGFMPATITEGQWTVYGRFGNGYYKPGCRHTLQPKWTEKGNERWAYHEHVDWEHGHETWLELIDPPE